MRFFSLARSYKINNLIINDMKKYRVEVAFQGERIVTVSAKTKREAQSKAHKRVRKMAIGSSVRTDWTDVNEYPEW